MSLINDMLRDLDSRNAAGSERSGLDHNVRALPGASGRASINPLLLALVAAALGGGAVWLLLKSQTPEAPSAAPTMPAPVAASPALAPPPSPGVEPALQVPPIPPVEAATPAETGLRMDTTISTPPALKPEAAAPSVVLPRTPVVPAQAATAPKAAAPVSPPKQANVPVEPSRNNATAHISKQPSDASSANEAADAEYRRGTTAIRRGDLLEGGDALRSALKISPAHLSARQALLSLLTEQQRWSEAETLALDGVGLYPQRSDWALLAARLMYERGEASGALSLLDQNASTAKQNPDYQILHALLLQRANRNAEAAECYQRALAVRPQEGRWWYGLGRALEADHRDALARQAFEKARETGNLPPDLQQAVERRLRQ